MKKFFIPLEIILCRFAARVTAWGNSHGDLNIPRTFLTGFIFAAISFGVFMGFSAGANSPFDIVFPIPELDNCADRDTCKTFCDDLAHKDACFEFAKKHGLADANAEERIKNLPPAGPGGCTSKESCKIYCDDADHQEECIAYAVEHGLMTRDEAARNRKLATGPGGCQGEKECKEYCEDPTHQDECFDFALKNGFIDKKEVREFKKQREQFIKLQDESPGGCKNEHECKAYCENPAHINECIKFAEEHGFMSREEAARIRKVGIVGGPGGCKGEKECHAYCEDLAHQTECIDFAEQNGFMSKEEAARARKFVGKTGPGGCRGEKCRNYCNDPAHQEECLAHAEREGLLSRDEIERIRKFTRAAEEGGPGGCTGNQCRDYCADTAHQEECFEFAKKNGLMRPDEEKEFERGKKIQEKVRESGGPGGCRDDEACRVYCTNSAHTEECVAYAVAHGGMTESQAREMLRHFLEQKFQGPEQFHPSGDFQQIQKGSAQKFEQFRQLEENFRDKFEGKFPGGMPPEAREKLLQQMREKPEMFGPFTMPPESGRLPFEGIGPIPGTPGVFGPMHMPPEGFDPSQGTFRPIEQYRSPDGVQFPAQYPQDGTQNYYPPQQGQYQYIPHEGGGTTYPSQYPIESQIILPPVTGDSYIPPPVMPPSTITPESFLIAPPPMPPPEGSFSPPPPGAEAPNLADFLATILLNFLR